MLLPAYIVHPLLVPLLLPLLVPLRPSLGGCPCFQKSIAYQNQNDHWHVWVPSDRQGCSIDTATGVASGMYATQSGNVLLLLHMLLASKQSCFGQTQPSTVHAGMLKWNLM